jgi:hypothetical protein
MVKILFTLRDMMLKKQIQFLLKCSVLIAVILFGCEYVQPDPFVTPEYPPHRPYNPDPPDGATGQPLNITLSWLASDPNNNIREFDVYFDVDSLPYDHLVSVGQWEMSYTAGILRSNTMYYWSIEVRDSFGNERMGDVWSFTTGDNDSRIDKSLNSIK